VIALPAGPRSSSVRANSARTSSAVTRRSLGFVRQFRPQLFATSDRTPGLGEVDVYQF
jgi:hypothetical protein